MESSSKTLSPLSESGHAVVAVIVALVATLMLLAWTPAEAFDSDAPKAESAYFQVASSEPGTDRLPLKSTPVDVRIAGVIADVTVTQHDRNEGQKIREKQQSRIEYETAKKKGRTSVLLESSSSPPRRRPKPIACAA